MPLTLTNVSAQNVGKGLKIGYADCQFPNPYTVGGETLDLSTAGSFGADGFSAVYAVLVEGPYTSAGNELGPAVAAKVFYNFDTARAVASGTLQVQNFSAADATGVWQESGAIDLSTVYCRIVVFGK